MIVVGAGLAGLIAASMLRGDLAGVFESQPSLPNNHSAVLRFRSSIVADTVNIPFRKVEVMKAAHPWRNPVADAMAYSRKTNGTSTLRSIARGTEIGERFIAPPDLIPQLADQIGNVFSFDRKFRQSDLDDDSSVISTMPMPHLMEFLGWPDIPEFRYVAGVNVIAKIEGASAYASLYVPDPSIPFARISITGDQLIAECYPDRELDSASKLIAALAADFVGIDPDRISHVQMKSQKYGKILPIDNEVRKRFIMWASDNFGIYSLGRFATWRPGLLLDDIINDVRVIQSLSKGHSNSYQHRLKG